MASGAATSMSGTKLQSNSKQHVKNWLRKGKRIASPQSAWEMKSDSLHRLKTHQKISTAGCRPEGRDQKTFSMGQLTGAISDSMDAKSSPPAIRDCSTGPNFIGIIMGSRRRSN